MKEGDLQKVLLSVIHQSREPLETTEIIKKVSQLSKGATRTKVLYRLLLLRGDQTIKGKQVGSGKGVWIWWR